MEKVGHYVGQIHSRPFWHSKTCAYSANHYKRADSFGSRFHPRRYASHKPAACTASHCSRLLCIFKAELSRTGLGKKSDLFHLPLPSLMGRGFCAFDRSCMVVIDTSVELQQSSNMICLCLLWAPSMSSFECTARHDRAYR